MRYARSDVVSVAITVEAGGCGASHSRPVTNGVPEELWKLECSACESVLVNDPLWSTTEAEIPETYDEKTSREDNEKRGERVLKKSQEQMAVNQQMLNERIVDMLEHSSGGKAQVDPDLIARLVQEQVAKALAEAKAPEESEPEAGVPLDLDKLHWKTLQKMSRDKGLPDNVGRDDMIKQLKSA